MKCPACDRVNAPSARACAGCKATLPPRCAGCGAPVDEWDELCRACRTEEVALPDETGVGTPLLDEDIEATGVGPSLAPILPPPPAAPPLDTLAAGPDPAFDDSDLTPLPIPLPAPLPAPLPGLPPAGLVAPAPDPAAPLEPAPVSDSARTAAIKAPPAPPDPEIDVEEEIPNITARLIGREGLLDRLRGLVEQAAKRREVQFVAVTGAPGTGKSMLAGAIPELARSIVPDARVYVARCAPAPAPPFAVFARLFAARFGIPFDASPDRARARITEEIAAIIPAGRATEVTHLIAWLMGVPFPDSPIVEPLAEKSIQLEARTFIAVRRCLMATAARQPLVLVFDDAERARPETMKLVQYLAAGLEGHPIALILLGRPNLLDEHPGLGQTDVELGRIEIPPLTPDEAAALFAELTAAAGEPPPALARHVRERLTASPRAVVELTRYLVETGGVRRVGTRWVFDRMRFARATLAGLGAAAPTLPSSMEEIVAARLAALAPASRDLLEKAAACGEVFWQDALAAISRASASADPDGPSLEEIESAGDKAREDIAGLLGELVRAGLLVESRHSRIPGERELSFAYPPWFEVTDRSLTPQARRRYHKLVAQWLELRPEGKSAAEQEEVGRHLEAAGDGDGAALRYLRAGDIARGRYFNDEAIRLYGRALGCIGEGEIATRIHLFHDLGSVYQLKGDYDLARRAFQRMLRLAWMVASRPKSAVAYNKLGRIDRQRGDLASALASFERGLDTFRRAGDERGVAGSLDDIAQVLWLLGRYDAALERGAAALEMRRRLGDKQSIALSLLTIGHIERHRGLFEEAEACYREALALRRDLGDKAGIAAALNGLGALSFQRGEFERAHACWEEGLSLAEEVGALPQVAILEGHLGEVAREAGNQVEARRRFERSEAAARDLGDKRLLSEALRNLGSLELGNAEIDKARELAQRSFELADAAGIKVDVGRALIMLGECEAQTLFHDQGDGQASAEEYFQRAVDLFRGIGNEAELGVALERLGSYRIERGELEAGKVLVAEAQEIFTRLGMKKFGAAVDRIMTELE